jgi:hypothetical protein
MGGIFAQRYDGSGALVGPEFRVNTYTTGPQYEPFVISDAAGNFVVAWTSNGEDSSGPGIFARRFTAAGGPAGLPFRVNTYVTGIQSDPSASIDGSGNFVVTWQSFAQDGNGLGVFGQRYDAAGVPQGGEFRINSYTTGAQREPMPAMDAAGNFVVVWQSYGQDGQQDGVFGQRFGSAGAAVGPEFRVNVYTTTHQRDAAVASDPDGHFVVAWSSYGQDGSVWGVFARRYDTAGVPLSGDFRVNGQTLLIQQYPSVTMEPDGDFTVAWMATGAGGPGVDVDVFARRFDALGTPEGDDFRVNVFTTGNQYAPSAASRPDGTTVVTWASHDQDGSSYGIYGQRFIPDLIFRDDFEAGDLGVWSASATDAGDLSVTVDAALGGSTAGLRGVVDDTAGLYVQDDRPDGERRYRARFYFDPNGFDPGEALNHRRVRLFLAFTEPSRRVAALVLRRLGGAYSVMARARRDDNTQADTGFVPISDGPHVFEFDLVRSSGPGANDGYISLFIDGIFAGSTSNLDNDLSDVDFARMGALSVKTGASGTMYWDQFVSRRLNYTGP